MELHFVVMRFRFVTKGGQQSSITLIYLFIGPNHA